MGKIQYKEILNDGTEKAQYSSKNTRKVVKKVGHKGNYSDVIIKSPFLNLEKTGTGTSVNPYVYKIDVADTFANSLSSQRTLVSEFNEKAENITNIKERLKYINNKNLQAKYKSISFSVNLLDFLTMQGKDKKINTLDVNYIYNPDKKNISINSLHYLDSKKTNRNWSQNNSFSLEGINEKEIHFLKTTFINDNSDNTRFKEDNKGESFKRASKDFVFNISKTLKVNFNVTNKIEFHFTNKNIHVTNVYLEKLLKENSKKGNAIIQFYIEYN
tara:strand:+ start:1738 stop:2553 length:816 start_codon:yes stop_codon:yes gene_type:complete